VHCFFPQHLPQGLNGDTVFYDILPPPTMQGTFHQAELISHEQQSFHENRDWTWEAV
jgi:hypothetical protein